MGICILRNRNQRYSAHFTYTGTTLSLYFGLTVSFRRKTKQTEIENGTDDNKRDYVVNGSQMEHA